jgi:plastocyanin
MLRKIVAIGALGCLSAVALPASAADQAVTFGPGLAYSPSEVHIVAGEKVTFTPAPGHDFLAGSGPNGHPLDFVDPSILDQTETPQGSSSVTRTFAQPGTYVFFCRNHQGQGMTGSVIVDAAPATSPGTTTGTTTTTSASQTTTTTSTSTTSVPVTAADTTAPTMTLPKLTVLRGLARRPAVIRFTASEAASASASLTARGVVLARGTKTFKNAGRQSLTLKLTTAGRKLLRRSPRLNGKLQIAVRDVAGNTTKLTRALTVAR